MQESEARAYFLRDMRRAKQAVDAFYKGQHEFGSKKHVLQFLKAFRDAHKDVTLYEYKKPSRHPWHFNHTFFYLEPSAVEGQGIGKLLMLQQTTLDSKKLIKNDLSDVLHANVTRELHIHQHFITRLIQRASLSGLAEALAIVAHSLAAVLLHIRFDGKHFEPGQIVHVVFPDKVFIAECESQSGVLIFKTVILEAFMTERQKRFYSAAIKQARVHKNGFVLTLEGTDEEKLSLID